MEIFNIKDFDVFADGKTLNTANLQAAIDACAENGGGIVRIEKGTYVLSTVFLKSNVTLEFEEGVEILGSLRYEDYCEQEKLDYRLYQDASHSYFHHSMFVGENCENIAIIGQGKIDMRSVWDDENKRDMEHRGAKCIALKNCKNVLLKDFSLFNVTDLAVYFAGCENVDVANLKMRVYIDGISPDCSKNVHIHDCEVESGDDGIVLKSSYTLNRKEICKNILVENCKIRSRVNAVKFGTETNGGFENVMVRNCEISDTRMAGIAVESVDGAIIDGVLFQNITMRNVGTPILVQLGKRLRGPSGSKIGEIKNIYFENVTATGPYEPYEIIEANYLDFIEHKTRQVPQFFGIPWAPNGMEWLDNWQISSSVCGLEGHELKNIVFKNVSLLLDGGVTEYEREVPKEPTPYPEVYAYGRFLPAKGIFFRHVDGLTLENVRVATYRDDARQAFIFENVCNLHEE